MAGHHLLLAVIRIDFWAGYRVRPDIGEGYKLAGMLSGWLRQRSIIIMAGTQDNIYYTVKWCGEHLSTPGITGTQATVTPDMVTLYTL